MEEVELYLAGSENTIWGKGGEDQWVNRMVYNT